MLRTIKNKLNNTKQSNSSNIIRLVNSFNEEVTLPLLTSDLLGEGIFSFEVVANDSFVEDYIVTPPFFREPLGEQCYRDYEYLNNSLKDITCYNIILSKPSFLPLFTQNSTSLLEDLSLLQQTNHELFIQLLITQRQDNWREGYIDQYDDFLHGNDHPSSKRVERSIQRSVLNVLNKVSGMNTQRKEVSEISNKILDIGYRFELRVIRTAGNTSPFENEMDDVLKEYDFFNSLRCLKDKQKKQFLDNFLNRKFSSISKDQLISESELLSVISDEQVVNKKVTILESMDEVKTSVTKFSNIDLLPIGQKKNRDVDEDIVSELPHSLKKAKATNTSNIEVLGVELGATVQRITFKIPEGHVFSDIKSKHSDIQAVMGNDMSIIQGNEPNTITFLIPCKERDVIYLKELLSDESFIKFTQGNPLPFVCGLDMYNQPVYKCLTKAPHLLVAGATNSGKSVMLNSLLITLILLRSPTELRIFLIDPKKVELSQYNGFEHVEKVVVDMNEAIETLDKLVNEMESRYEKFAKLGVRKIDAYNNKSKSKMPYIVAAIDEYNDLRMTNPEVEKYIERLGQKARASGIHLIIATQRPDKNVMSGVIKTNIPSRIAFKLDNSNEYRTVFGTGIPFKNLLGFGDGVIKFVGQVEEFIRFQAPVITLDENEEELTFDKIKNLYKDEQFEELEVVESYLDRLKRIIATQNETRVGHLQKEMKMRINTVQDLMQQLVVEGWLAKPESKNKGYQLIASEEELVKWRSQ